MRFEVPAGITVTTGLFTQTTLFECEVKMRQRRLTDYLNGLEEQFFTVEKSRVTVLSGASGPAQSLPFAEINRESVVFAVPYSGEGGEDTEQRHNVFVTKLPRRVGIIAPPFLIQGDMHLLKETGLRDAMMALRQLFVPLTNATALYLPTGKPYQAATIIVNRERMEAFYPA